MYSRYKNAYTVKVLIAITPNGLICFLSKCYGGKASDTFIINDSGFLLKLESEDEVLADKGFSGIKVPCDEKQSILVMPPILHNGRFTEEEVIKTYNVASVHIHIERVFARSKITRV
uniref:DDE Tnp4 domain-containing protein n=1 Tax=Sipha flava TaxID=143950 RepID=A0A2S2R4Z5_9HEMI